MADQKHWAACAGCEGCESCEGCEGCEGCEHCKGLLALGVDDIMDIPMPIPTPYEIYYRQVNGGYVPIERNPYHAQNIDRYRELAALWEQHKEKLLQKKLRQMKLQQQKLEQQKLEQQKLEQEKIEQQKLEQQKLEQQRLEQQKLEEEKLQLEQLQQEQLQQEQWQQQLPPYTTQSGLTIYQCDVFNQPISNLGPMFAFYIAQHPKPDLPKWNSYLNPEPYVGKPAIASRPIEDARQHSHGERGSGSTSFIRNSTTIYTNMNAAGNSASTTTTTSKSPRKQQKQRINDAGNKRDTWILTSTATDRAEFSSNEDLATCKKDMPPVKMDEEDPGTMDDVNTSESESSPKIRRKENKKSPARQRRTKKAATPQQQSTASVSTTYNTRPIYIAAQQSNKETVNRPRYSLLGEQVMSEMDRIRALTPPLRQHIKLNLPDPILVQFLNQYVLSRGEMDGLGYPYRKGNKVYFLRKRYTGITETKPLQKAFDVNAQEFVPSHRRCVHERKNSSSGDSGQATGSSSSAHSTDNESSDNMPDLKGYGVSERKCVRCSRLFHVDPEGEYLVAESCTYHWGKSERNPANPTGPTVYACCHKTRYSKGCSQADAHVWNGYVAGYNGPLDDFVETQPLDTIPYEGHEGAYAMDCEMSYTGFGLEATKVTVVATDGRLVYEKFIRPKARIIDYNTRFSGITKKDLSAKNGSVLTLPEVQEDLLKFISAGTILIGHALENDLRALKLIHYTIIDSSIIFPHLNGLGFKHSLKTLTSNILKRSIQTSDMGHSSFEDSRACLEIVLWRVRKDYRTILEHFGR